MDATSSSARAATGDDSLVALLQNALALADDRGLQMVAIHISQALEIARAGEQFQNGPNA